MSKEQAKRVTFDQLIARKMQREQDKLKITQIYIPSLDATMQFKKIPDEQILDIMNDYEDTQNLKAGYQANKKLIYLCSDDLQNPELHKNLGITDPFDAVGCLFTISEITLIVNQLMEFLGIQDKEQKIKN